jgi:steroid 5-alpha reductase family enzyme
MVGIWLIALGVPGGWFGIAGPLTITFLILKVSGIPMLERRWPRIQISRSTNEGQTSFFA